MQRLLRVAHVISDSSESPQSRGSCLCRCILVHLLLPPIGPLFTCVLVLTLSNPRPNPFATKIHLPTLKALLWQRKPTQPVEIVFFVCWLFFPLAPTAAACLYSWHTTLALTALHWLRSDWTLWGRLHLDNMHTCVKGFESTCTSSSNSVKSTAWAVRWSTKVR